MRQTFQQDEAGAILIQAVRRSTAQESAAVVSPEVTREELVEMAGELGVSAEALAVVARDTEAENAQDQSRAGMTDVRRDFILHRRKEFFGHLAFYIIVNVAVVLLWQKLQPFEDFWPRWSILGWGILVAWHALALRQSTGREFDRELALWQVKRFRQRSRRSARRKRRLHNEA